MEWQAIKDKIYYEDGSLRDILVKGCNEQDWILWADFVNKNYTVRIDNYKIPNGNGRIDIQDAIKFWEDVSLERFSASISVGNALVNVYFFGPSEIENDILPAEISSMDEHQQILAYMINISKILNKEVILTPENTEQTTLIAVNQDSVIII